MKLTRVTTRGKRQEVAPRRGAWVETLEEAKKEARDAGVAPRRGAWVETSKAGQIYNSIASHPAGVRGLKLEKPTLLPMELVSHPAGVRGLKRLFEGGWP